MLFNLDCEGIYLSRRNGVPIFEICFTDCNKTIWIRTSIELLDIYVDALTQFFMQNISNFRINSARVHIPFINGIYIMSNGNNFDARINISVDINGIGTWYILNIFNTDINNSIYFFLLHIGNGYGL